MFGADYAWILHESMGPPWTKEMMQPIDDCLYGQLMEAVENLIIVSSHNSIVGNQIGLSGLVRFYCYFLIRISGKYYG